MLNYILQSKLVNAGTFNREITILLNWLAIPILPYSCIKGYDSLYIITLDPGIGIYGSLFHSTSITQGFYLFISIIGAIVWLLTAIFYLGTVLLIASSALSIYTDGYWVRYKNKLIK